MWLLLLYLPLEPDVMKNLFSYKKIFIFVQSIAKHFVHFFNFCQYEYM